MKQFSNLDHIKYLDLSVYIRKSGSFIEPLKLMVTILSYLNPVTTLDIYLEKNVNSILNNVKWNPNATIEISFIVRWLCESKSKARCKGKHYF